ncbi:MAG TPA: phospholipase C, phosphocholine-specific [Acidobacteriaceae bacterium]|nr:phospholipase C, phosphocholine-specific [Acidobacteriaceae bacterium]
MQTRRDFLKLAALLSGAAGVSGFVPDSIQRAYAIAPEPGSTWLDAEHIVILMQENRSFDHALGMLRGVRGFNDPRAIRLPNGNSVFVQTDKAGISYAPWRLDMHDTRITWMGSIPHSRNSQVDAWNEGRHNDWLDAKRSYNQEYANVPMTMGHYTREDLPFYYALADAFTVCDQNYCGVMTSTTPNRSSFWTGTVRDRQSTDSRVFMRNDQYVRGGGMVWKTYPERLQEAGIRWKFYQNDTMNSGLRGEEDAWLGNFGCNLLEFFAAYNIRAYSGYVKEQQQEIAHYTAELAELENEVSQATDPDRIDDLKSRMAYAQKRIAECRAALADSGEARYRQLTPQQKALFHAAFVTNEGDPDYHTLESLPFANDGKQLTMNVPRGDILYQFRKDVENGNLPTISWLTAPENFSDHPVSPWYGAWYVSEVMDILTKNPDVWKKTIFILTYDENDGYFDHAPSFVAADPKRPWTGGASAGIDTGIEYTYKEDELVQGVPEKEARTGPIGMGFRVPMIIASPWSRGGWVNSQLFDHTSTLLFLEQFVQQKFDKRVREENISAWRRAISGNLTSIFRPYDPKEPELDFLNRDQFVVSIQKSRYKEVPSNYKPLDTAEIAQINRSPPDSPLVPHQEPGFRRACALPYELYAEGGLSADGKAFELRMTAGNRLYGSRAAGAPFNVYLRNLRQGTDGEVGGMRAATWAVRAGDTLKQQFPLALFEDANYAIDVHGPNGFFRSFRGSRAAHPLAIRLEYEVQDGRCTGNVRVHLRSTSGRSVQAIIEDNSSEPHSMSHDVHAADEKAVTLHLSRSHAWYDFAVKAAGSEAEARFAGHVETGRPGFSDPRMGGVV